MEGEYISLDTAKKLAKAKALLPEGVEAVVISKDDYDRLSGELTKENIELKLEIERLNNIIKQQNTRNSRQRVANRKLLERNQDLVIENLKLNNIIDELEKDFERKIQNCTIEAETTTNDFYCRLHIATLKKWLNKIKELKGVDKE